MFQQLKAVFIGLFGSPVGALLFFPALIITIALGVWTRRPWRGLYWLYVVVGILPLLAYVVALPIIHTSGWISYNDREVAIGYFVWWVYLSVASPFGVGVLLGALLAPVFRWGLSPE